MNRCFWSALIAVLLVSSWCLAQPPLPSAVTPQSPAPGKYEQLPPPVAVPETGDKAASPFTLPAGAQAIPSFPVPTTVPTANQDHCPTACDPGCPRGPTRCYFFTDYLLWRIKRRALPAVYPSLPVGIATVESFTFERTVPESGAPPPFTAADLTLTTTNFFPVQLSTAPGIPPGADNVGDHCGIRFGGGFWLDEGCCWGLETQFFFLEKRSSLFNTTADNANTQSVFNRRFPRGEKNQPFIFSEIVYGY